MTMSTSLSVEKIRKSFGARRVLNDVSFSVQAGEILVVRGPNGVGKSTLVKIVAGLMRPSRGTVTRRPSSVFSLGYATPDLHLAPELTGCEHLHFFATLKGLAFSHTDAEGALERVGLSGRGGDPVSAYSSGMRQRLKLAFATLGAPPILILDEPSLALDTDGVEMTRALILAQKSRGLVLLATNDPQEATLGTQELCLD
jgi:ABC-type multidrug transport system ATPase subunit